MACSYCARRMPAFAAWARAASSCACACATAWSESSPGRASESAASASASPSTLPRPNRRRDHERVLGAQLVVIDGEFGVRAQADVLEVGRARLRGEDAGPATALRVLPCRNRGRPGGASNGSVYSVKAAFAEKPNGVAPDMRARDARGAAARDPGKYWERGLRDRGPRGQEGRRRRGHVLVGVCAEAILELVERRVAEELPPFAAGLAASRGSAGFQDRSVPAETACAGSSLKAGGGVSSGRPRMHFGAKLPHPDLQSGKTDDRDGARAYSPM